MTVPLEIREKVQRGNGVATSVSFTFTVVDAEDLIVQRRVYATQLVDLTYTAGVDYTFTTNYPDAGGSVNFLIAAVSSDYEIVLTRTLPYTQELRLLNTGGFYPTEVEKQLDKIVMQVQQVKDAIADLDISTLAVSTAYQKLFVDIGTTFIDAATTAIKTSGHTVLGIGAATYVTDATANAALALAHPLFCKQSLDGRYWRLVPEANGALSLNAAGVVGTATELHTTNHQPGFQALVKYGEAIGVLAGYIPGGVYYSLWTPLRTAVNDDISGGDLTGIPIVHLTSWTWLFGEGKPILKRRKNDGSDPATFAGTQILAQNAVNNGNTIPWRGGMFLLNGQAAAPAKYEDRHFLRFYGDAIIDGGIARSATPGLVQAGAPLYYKLNADGSGWDITDKGVWLRQNRYHGGQEYYGNIRFTGFRGETVGYAGGNNPGQFIQRGVLELYETDGDGFNPNTEYLGTLTDPGRIDADHIRIYHAYQGIEANMGHNASIRVLEIVDCTVAGGFAGGAGAGSSVDSITGKPSKAHVGLLRVERSPNCVIGPKLSIERIDEIDCNVSIGGNSANDCFDTDIGEVRLTVDGSDITNAVIFSSKITTAGTKATDRIRIGSIHCEYTANATANGHFCVKPYSWNGSIGSFVHIGTISGKYATGPVNTAPTPDYQPLVRDMGGAFFTNFPGRPQHNGETTPTLAVLGPLQDIISTTNSGAFDVTLPAPGTIIPNGYRRNLVNRMSVATFMIATTNTLLAHKTILPPNHHITFELRDGAWKLVEGAPDIPLKGSAVFDPANQVDAAGVTTTVTVAGAALGDQTRASFSLDLQSIIMTSWVSAANTVSVRFQNETGGALDLASGTIKAEVFKG